MIKHGKLKKPYVIFKIIRALGCVRFDRETDFEVIYTKRVWHPVLVVWSALFFPIFLVEGVFKGLVDWGGAVIELYKKDEVRLTKGHKENDENNSN